MAQENMTPELDMEELNKRRVERYHRRQQANAKKKRKKMTAMVLVCILMIALGASVFFLVRAGEKEENQEPTVMHSDEEIPEDER